MLIQLQAPPCATALREATERALQFLSALAELPDPVESAGINALLHQPPHRWLRSAHHRPAKEILALGALPRSERRALCEAYTHDVGLFDAPRATRFALKTPQLCDTTKKCGGRFMNYLYESRFRELGLRIAGSPVPIDRAFVEDSFHAVNPKLRMCPACLIGDLPKPIRTENNKVVTNVDCDHFFPLSVFPAFAIHPHNLVFVCLLCNERHKGDRRPSPESHFDRDTVWMPYFDHGIAELRFEFSIDYSGSPMISDDKLRVHVYAKTDGVGTEVRWHNHNLLYNLLPRWNQFVASELSTMYELLRARAATWGLPSLNQQFVEDQLRDEILREITLAQRGMHLRVAVLSWLLAYKTRALSDEALHLPPR